MDRRWPSRLPRQLTVIAWTRGLDAASPTVAYQALKTGRLIADADRRRRVDFVAHLPGRYEDIRIIRREAERTLLRRMAHGRA